MVAYNVASGMVVAVGNVDRRLSRLRRKVNAFKRFVAQLRSVKVVHVVITQAQVGYIDAAEVMRFVRRRVKNIVCYLWVRELQKRGAEHLHVLLVVPSYTVVSFLDREKGWKWGMTSVSSVYSVRDICKYLQKSLLDKGRRMSQAVIRDDVLKRLWGWLNKGYNVSLHDVTVGCVRNTVPFRSAFVVVSLLMLEFIGGMVIGWY